MQHTYTQRSPSFFGFETVTLVTLKKSQNQSEVGTQTVVYHLQKFSGKSGSRVNGTRLFGSSQRKISGSNVTSEKVVLFFRMEYSNRKLAIHFFKAIFNTSFRPSRPFSGKWNWFIQMVNAIPIPGRNLQSWTLRTIYPNREPKVLLFIIVLEFPRLVLIRHYDWLAQRRLGRRYTASSANTEKRLATSLGIPTFIWINMRSSALSLLWVEGKRPRWCHHSLRFFLPTLLISRKERKILGTRNVSKIFKCNLQFLAIKFAYSMNTCKL